MPIVARTPPDRSRSSVSRMYPSVGRSSNSSAAVFGLYGPIRQYRSPHREIIAGAFVFNTV